MGDHCWFVNIGVTMKILICIPVLLSIGLTAAQEGDVSKEFLNEWITKIHERYNPDLVKGSKDEGKKLAYRATTYAPPVKPAPTIKAAPYKPVVKPFKSYPTQTYKPVVFKTPSYTKPAPKPISYSPVTYPKPTYKPVVYKPTKPVAY